MSDQVLVDVDDVITIVLLVCAGHDELGAPLGRDSESLHRAIDALNAILERVDREVAPGGLEVTP